MSEAARARATVADLVTLRDRGEPVELIDGEIVHKAMPRPAHGRAQLTLGEILAPFRRRAGGPRGPGGWWLMTEVEVAYPINGDVYRHDAVGFRRERVPELPGEIPLDIRPDWVCEILSTTTARYDVVKKQRTLHQHGVPHYWLLDPESRTLVVLRHTDAGYLNVLAAGIGDVIRAEPFDAIEIDLSDFFGTDG